MKNILFLISLVSLLLGNNLTITKDFTSVTTKEYQTIVEDKDKNITVADILENRYQENYFKDRSGPTRSVFWSKLTLKNSADKNMHIIFQNQRAGTDKIDVFIYKGKQLIKTHRLGDLRKQGLRDNISLKSVFHLNIPSDEEYTIISRLENLGPINISWKILNERIFSEKTNKEFLFNGIFAGVLTALILYNFMLFISLRDISFLLYVLLTSSMLWIQYTFSGMFYFLDLGINLTFLSLSAWFVPYLYSGLFLLFAIKFFKVYDKNKRIYYSFMGLAAIGFSMSLGSLYLFIDPSLAVYTPYSYIYLYIALLSIFIYAIYAVFKGYPFSGYFLVGEAAYLSTFFYSILVISGVLEISSNLQFLVPSAMMVEVVIFSIALSKKVMLLRQSNDSHEILLVEESKFSAIGKGIGNVAHQWKTPLSQLNTHLLYLQGLYYTGDEKKLIQEFGNSIKSTSNIMNYMKGSIEELHDFYSDVDRNRPFKVKKQILLAMDLQYDQLILNNISVNIECDEEESLHGTKHGFANIMMILFDNTIFQFEKQNIADAKIDIRVVKIDNTIEIYFRDNAGGITVKPIDKIFDMHFSTKGREGCGLGLPLAKALAKKAIDGEISVQNNDGGAEFRLTIYNAMHN